MYIDPLIIIIKAITMQLKKNTPGVSFLTKRTHSFSPLFSSAAEKRITPRRVKRERERDNNLSGGIILIITLIYYNTRTGGCVGTTINNNAIIFHYLVSHAGDNYWLN